MFLDLRDPWPQPEPWRGADGKCRVTKRGERVIGWIIGFNLLMLLIGPLAGATIVEGIVAMVRG